MRKERCFAERCQDEGIVRKGSDRLCNEKVEKESQRRGKRGGVRRTMSVERK